MTTNKRKLADICAQVTGTARRYGLSGVSVPPGFLAHAITVGAAWDPMTETYGAAEIRGHRADGSVWTTAPAEAFDLGQKVTAWEMES